MNLSLHQGLARVTWCGQGGLTLPQLHDCQLTDDLARIKPQAVVLHIGSNDLTYTTVDSFLDYLCGVTLPWLFSIGCQHITLCEILFRCKGFYTKSLNLEKYNNKVLVANQALRSIAAGARGHVNISFWEHKDLKQSGQINTIFHADGVHLRQRGLPLLYRSMRGAVLHLLHHTPRYAVF